MGQGDSAPFGCSFNKLYICEADEGPSRVLAVPSQCRCAHRYGQAGYGRLNQGYSVDPTTIAHFPGGSSFSTAVKAVHHASGEVRVVRIVPKKCCDRDRLIRELEVLCKLDHPNLSSIYEFVVADDSKITCICMEYVPGNDLFSSMALSGRREGAPRTTPRATREYEGADILRQLLFGLQHLHGAGVTHEAVHPRNILIATGAWGQELRLKLIDYGLATKYGTAASSVSKLYHGSHCLAPEQVKTAVTVRGVMLTAPSVDIWATGVVAFLLLSRHWPFEADTLELLRERISSSQWSFQPAEAWISISSAGKSFVKHLLSASPDYRPSATQALDNVFFAQLDVPPHSAPIDAVSSRKGVPGARTEDEVGRGAAHAALFGAVVDSFAMQLSVAQINEFKRHFGQWDSSCISLESLRRVMVKAEIALPGHVLNMVGIAEMAQQDKLCRFHVHGLVEAALVRKRGLEAALLWVALCLALPDGSQRIHRNDLPKLLEFGGPVFAELSGAAIRIIGTCDAASPSDASLAQSTQNTTEFSYDDLLACLQGSRQSCGGSGSRQSRRGADDIPDWLNPKLSPDSSRLLLQLSLPSPEGKT